METLERLMSIMVLKHTSNVLIACVAKPHNKFAYFKIG